MTAKEFYSQEIQIQKHNLNKANRALSISSLVRLLVFLTAGFGIYYFIDVWKLAVFIAVASIGIFLFLVARHTDLKYKRDKIKELVKLNEKELKILKREFEDQPTGQEFEDPLHNFSHDIDLFGKGSFFQYLNRTSLREGMVELVRLLTENSISDIFQKQEAIKELGDKPKWRQEFSAIAKQVKTETSSHWVLNWFKDYQTFIPKYVSWLPWVVTVISALLVTAYFLDFVTGFQFLLWFIACWVFSGFYLKRINFLANSVSKVQDTFHQYYQLLELIELNSFESDILKEKKALIRTEQKKASQILKEFSRAIDSMDQRNNMIFMAIGNGLLLWDLRQGYKLEKWINEYSQNVENWFDVIEFFDAYNSLGNFAFNHKDYTFPILCQDEFQIKAESLAHPLLNPDKRIANDFEIKQESFFIVTGANMAGKSTFLRTVSLHIVMANLGLPVCAKQSVYTPVKLITSMRTTDSLTDDESYFFSELKRLQYIVEEIKKDNYFIILDEILKGTNSTDKAIGSRKFIQKLVGSNSTGIIATHDLSLCEVANELPEVHNHYFDAEIIDDELHFDYKFKDGVCQNMNASFLLKKMNIVD